NSSGILCPGQWRDDHRIKFRMPPASCSLISLGTASFAKWDVSLALIAALCIPVTFTVAKEDKRFHLFSFRYFNWWCMSPIPMKSVIFRFFFMLYVYRKMPKLQSYQSAYALSILLNRFNLTYFYEVFFN